MTTIALTGQNFEDTLKSSEIVLIDFWATWCGPCRNFAPIYEAVSEKNPDITFAKVDTDAEQELASAAQITSVPTVMAIREGIPVFAQPGALPQDALEDVIAQVRALDMEEVRQQVAQAAAQPTTTPTETASTPPTGADVEMPADEQPAQPQREGGRSGRQPGVDYPDSNGAIV